MKEQKNKQRLIAQPVTYHHRAEILRAGQALMSKQRPKSRLRIDPHHVTYVAAAAAAAFVLMLLSPRLEILNPSMSPSMIGIVPLDPSEIEDLDLVMELDELEIWEEVEEWPES